MQDSNGKRFGALVTTIPLLILAIVMLGAPSASALMPFHGFLGNHHASFASSFLGASSPDTTLLPYHGQSVNYHSGSTAALKLYQGADNINSHITNTVSFAGVKHSSKTVNQPSYKESGNNNNNYKYSDSNNNNNYKYSDSNSQHGLDVQDKSFINGIKITDVDRSNPHLLKVTLERTHNDNGNIPKYISVVAVGKNDQTVAGSTTLNSDDINNSLTVDVILKNKNNKNGHLDSSSDVTVWVVPATISN
ncbi:MAG TPA: hypothetical protein VEL70_05810 [Candidatus Acidoferrum sp.]|nr:hypothetical protein [Candidatus Acidoferrum sp.]